MTLLRPFWILTLLALALLLWRLLRRRGGIGAWEVAANPVLLQALEVLGKVERQADHRPLLWRMGAAVLIVLALTGPALERREALSFRNLDAVVFVLEVPEDETEIWPQVLTLGRFGIAALGSRPGALVLFSGDAYMATDLTMDHRQLGQTLSLIVPGMIPDPGQRPERGLALALQVLQEAEILTGDVVLLTSGAGLRPDSLAQAEAIRAEGARLSVVALAPPTPEMQGLAQVGQGQLFGSADVEGLARFLSEQGRSRLQRQDYPLLYWQDYGRYLLLLAALPLLGLFRRARV